MKNKIITLAILIVMIVGLIVATSQFGFTQPEYYGFVRLDAQNQARWSPKPTIVPNLNADLCDNTNCASFLTAESDPYSIHLNGESVATASIPFAEGLSCAADHYLEFQDGMDLRNTRIWYDNTAVTGGLKIQGCSADEDAIGYCRQNVIIEPGNIQTTTGYIKLKADGSSGVWIGPMSGAVATPTVTPNASQGHLWVNSQIIATGPDNLFTAGIGISDNQAGVSLNYGANMATSKIWQVVPADPTDRPYLMVQAGDNSLKEPLDVRINAGVVGATGAKGANVYISATTGGGAFSPTPGAVIIGGAGTPPPSAINGDNVALIRGDLWVEGEIHSGGDTIIGEKSDGTADNLTMRGGGAGKMVKIQSATPTVTPVATCAGANCLFVEGSYEVAGAAIFNDPALTPSANLGLDAAKRLTSVALPTATAGPWIKYDGSSDTTQPIPFLFGMTGGANAVDTDGPLNLAGKGAYPVAVQQTPTATPAFAKSYNELFVEGDAEIAGGTYIQDPSVTPSTCAVFDANKKLTSSAPLTTGNLTATSPIALSATRQVIGGAAAISHASTAGNKHVPTSGLSGQVLRNTGVSGTAGWGTVTETSGALSAVTSITMSSFIDQKADSYISQGSGNDARITYDGTNWSFDVLQPTTSIIFNDSGLRTNFRIESDAATDTFYVDGSSNRVGIGTTAPAQLLDVDGTATAIEFHLDDGEKQTFGTGSDAVISYSGTDWTFDLTAATGEISFNDSSYDVNFRIEGNGDANLFTLDAGLDKIGIGVSAPTSKLDINGDIELPSTGNVYLGDPTTEGSWRIVRSGNNLVFERYESSAWVTKSTMTP